jgi:hypothetical protein
MYPQSGVDLLGELVLYGVLIPKSIKFSGERCPNLAPQRLCLKVDYSRNLVFVFSSCDLVDRTSSW